MNVYFTAAAVALVLSASPTLAQYKRDSRATGYFCEGFYFLRCSPAPVDALSKDETSQKFPIEQLFGFVTSHDPDTATCRVNNDTRFGDPKYHAHAQRRDGSWVYLGVPHYYTFACSAFQ